MTRSFCSVRRSVPRPHLHALASCALALALAGCELDLLIASLTGSAGRVDAGDPFDVGPSSAASFDALCQQLSATRCSMPACPNAPAVDEEACNAVQVQRCEEATARYEQLEQAGRAQFDQEAADRCAAVYAQHIASEGALACRENGDIDLIRDHRRTFWPELTCTEGIPSFGGDLEDVCRAAFGILAEEGEPCSSDLECAGRWGICEGAEEGCGVCVRRLKQPGEACTEPTQNGYSIKQCVNGYVCDAVEEGGICVPYVGVGEPCGPGIGGCSGACGLQCSDREGEGVCELLPSVGESCQGWCREGASCVGYDFAEQTPGTCLANAVAGESCSRGVNQAHSYDLYLHGTNGRDGHSGSSWGQFPLCDPPFVCQFEEGDGGVVVDGVCAPGRMFDSNEPCQAYPLNTCLDPLERCLPFDGDPSSEYRCRPQAEVGEPCRYLTECAEGSECLEDPDDPDGSICIAVSAEAGPCDDDDDCSFYAACIDGACTADPEVLGPQAFCEMPEG